MCIRDRFGGGRMSGDVGLEEPIIFYHKKMSEAKKIVLKHKGIELDYLEINSQKRWQEREDFFTKEESSIN